MIIEIDDTFHDFIRVEVENIEIDVEKSSYESHGIHVITEYAMTYDVIGATSLFGDKVKLDKNMIKAMESKIIELEEAYC